MLGLKASLVKAFGWSLYDIDNTDIESLMPFIFEITGNQDKSGKREKKIRRVFCDDPSASWL